MDLNRELDALAQKLGRASDYRLSGVLGYKNRSTVGEIRKGRKRMSLEKYRRLLELLGKSFAVAALTIAALLGTTGDVSAAADRDAGKMRSEFDRSIHYTDKLIRLVRMMLASFSSVLASAACRQNPA